MISFVPVCHGWWRWMASALLHLLEQVCRTEPALAAGLAAIPPAAPVQAVEFIEFATSPDEAPALVARLGVARILYDQNDTGGSFFQRYSLSRPDGLFFEVVERRRGYGGYGAANAPYRIAARKRFARPAGMPRL
ncbi:MAG: hypothetical protein Q8Q26_15005 [Pseudorhodobacter sp.]|nr:hypothetical protein [Pseudorhodobacter sp.]